MQRQWSKKLDKNKEGGGRRREEGRKGDVVVDSSIGILPDDVEEGERRGKVPPDDGSPWLCAGYTQKKIFDWEYFCTRTTKWRHHNQLARCYAYALCMRRKTATNATDVFCPKMPFRLRRPGLARRPSQQRRYPRGSL